MPEGYCALCHSFAVLSESHIIPNAYFRQMKRNSSGQLVAFDDSRDKRARRSMESHWEHLLCASCERKISGWETPCIDALRRSSRQAEKHMSAGGVSLHRFDYAQLRLFLLSVLWKAAASTLRVFSNVVIEAPFQEELRLCLLDGRSPGEAVFACRLRKLVQGGISLSTRQMEGILVTPPAPATVGRVAIHTFLFGGYVVDYFVPRAPYKHRQLPGIVQDRSSQFVPTVAIEKVPHLAELLLTAMKAERVKEW